MRALECAKVKKPNPLLEEIRFEIVQGGTCVQILHIGAYDDELVSFAMLDKFARALSLTRAESCHREIYLNNANRTEKKQAQNHFALYGKIIPCEGRWAAVLRLTNHDFFFIIIY